MSKIVFIQFGESRQLELKINGDFTWMHVAEEFLTFLQGCGYQVSGEDLRDYFIELCGDPETVTLSDFDTDYFGTGGGDTFTISVQDDPEYNFDPLTNVMNNWNPSK